MTLPRLGNLAKVRGSAAFDGHIDGPGSSETLSTRHRSDEYHAGSQWSHDACFFESAQNFIAAVQAEDSQEVYRCYNTEDMYLACPT